MYDIFYFFSVKAFQQEYNFLSTSTPDSLLLHKRSNVGASKIGMMKEQASKGQTVGQMTQTVNKKIITSHMTVHENKHAFTLHYHIIFTQTPHRHAPWTELQYTVD